MALVVISYPNISVKHYQWIQSMRAQYDPQYSIINPHFTIVFPCPVENPGEVIKHVEGKSRGIKKIFFLIERAITIKDSLSENTNLYLIPDKGSEDIARLHDKLYSGLLASELRPDIPFIPHITIGNETNPARLQNLERNLSGQNLKIEGTLDILDVALFKEGQHVNTLKRIKLGT